VPWPIGAIWPGPRTGSGHDGLAPAVAPVARRDASRLAGVPR